MFLYSALSNCDKINNFIILIKNKQLTKVFLKKKKIKSYKDLDAKATLIENFSNLVFVNKILNKIEYFVFFGTLLGLVREKNLIKNDDDIDIYINIKDRNKVIEILQKNSVIVDLNLSVNKEKCFLQVKRTINNKNAIIDFYFYEEDTDKSYIIEKWNFGADPGNPSKYLRIPKIFTHPIKKIKIKSHKFNLPAQPEYLCEFLYGKNWKKKLKKDVDYEIKVIDGKPVKFIFDKNFFGKKKLVLIQIFKNLSMHHLSKNIGALRMIV